MRRETLGTRYPSTLRTTKHLRGCSVGLDLKAEGDLAAAAWLRCCYARGQAQDFPDEGDDRRGKAPPLLSARVPWGVAAPASGTTVSFADMGHVYMLAAMLVHRIEWFTPSQGTQLAKGAHGKSACVELTKHSNFNSNACLPGVS